jgi:hypothetical protein
MEKEAEKILIAKLRQPIHIGYISQYILKLPIDKTREIINKLIEDGIVEESGYAKDYFVIKHIEKKD